MTKCAEPIVESVPIVSIIRIVEPGDAIGSQCAGLWG